MAPSSDNPNETKDEKRKSSALKKALDAPCKASLRVEDDAQSARQLKSLKPPPRTTVPIDQTNDSKTKKPKRISVPAIDQEDLVTLGETAAVDLQPTVASPSERPPPESSGSSRSGRPRSNRRLDNSNTNKNGSKSPGRARRAGRRKENGDLDSPTKKKRRPPDWNTLREAAENSLSNLQRSSSAEPTAEPATPAATKPSSSRSTKSVKSPRENGENAQEMTTTTTATNRVDSIRSEKIRAARGKNELMGEHPEGDEENARKPPAAPGAFRMRPSTSNQHSADDEEDDAQVPTAHVAPVAAAAAAPAARSEGRQNDHAPSKTQWRDTGMEKEDQEPNGHSLSNVGAGIPIAAELVPDQEELERRLEEQMQERLKKEVDKRLERERERHVVAEAVHIDDDPKSSGSISAEQAASGTSADAARKRKKRIIIGGAVVGMVLILAAIIGGVVSSKNKEPAPTMAPTIETTESYKSLVNEIGSLVAADVAIFFSSMDTPQYKAMYWLANEDSWGLEDRTPEMLIERYVLALVYYSTEGPKWKEQYSFLEPTSICTWNDGTSVWASNTSWFDGAGVYCGENERVEEIWLGPVKASGSLPTELGLFPHLRAFQMFDCFLDGPIPTSIFSLQNLTLFDVSDAQGLSGTIPTEVGKAPFLQTLQLGGNRLGGPIPEELWQLTQLIQLELFECTITGSISPSIAKMTNLAGLDLSVNRLSESLPEELYSLTKLEYLLVYSNLFTGTLSSNIGKLSQNLYELDVGQNRLSGPLPTELGNLENLQSLWLEYNEFTGTIPSHIAAIPDLQVLSIYENPGLSGPMPLNFQNADNLVQVQLENTNLTGLEAAFCNAGRNPPIQEFSADCLGEVECSCCTICCNNGVQCV